MTTKRQIKFMDQVAEAARTIPLPKPRGCLMLGNLSKEGRAKGLKAMQAASRCQSRRKDGQACKNAAMRGATKCMKHGGRVQVPNHPHNIRRFISGEMHRAAQRQNAYLEDRAVLERMSYQEQNDFIAVRPESIVENPRKLYRSARLLKEAEDSGYAVRSKILVGIVSGELF